MSSKRRLRRKQCIGKHPYADYKAAERVVREKWKRGIQLMVYKCSFCGFHHVGHLRRPKLAKFAGKKI